MSDDFIGRGWAFPVRADKTGGIALVSRERELAESIELILRTPKGDRPMRPEFGCGIWDEVFSPMDATTAGRVAYDVRAALERWEPRINVTAVDVHVQRRGRGRMDVWITYAEARHERPPQPGIPVLCDPGRAGDLMPLPVPNLDDRRFQDLVDDAKRLVQQRCPDWTDHNVSDPGVTLIETFAFMVDQLLYRLNRVPERNYVKFLDMLGVRLFAPSAARAPVTFWLSAPQADVVRIPAGTEVATVRTDVDEALVFTVEADLDIVPCSLIALRSQPSGGLFRDHSDTLQGGPGLPCFSPMPQPGDALYVGLSDPVPRCAVAMRFRCRIEGVGVDPLNPPLRWEAYDGTDWARCEVDSDGTGGLNRPGDVIVHVPPTHVASVVDQERAGWLRAVVTQAVEGQPSYSSSPQIDGLEAFTKGGTIEASHAKTVEREVLGASNGAPGQRMPVKEKPVLAGEGSSLIDVSDDEGWEEWTEVEGFADSGASDRHFVFDRSIGEVVFGPAVRCQDGSVQQYGAVPAKGATVRLRSYRTGGGSRGNVAAGQISVARSSIPYVTSVKNRRAASGSTVRPSKRLKCAGHYRCVRGTGQ